MNRMLIVALAGSAVLAAACSGSGGHAASSPSITSPLPTSSAAPASSTTAPAPTPAELTGVPSPTSTDQGTISLSANWKEFVPDFKKGWHATCLIGDACTGINAISQGVDSARYDSTSQQIRFEYDGPGDTDNTAAKLDLGHFALYFSGGGATQTDFQDWVTSTMDSMPVGTVRTVSHVPLRETLERPADEQWVLVISQA